jgi:hypothetical protein
MNETKEYDMNDNPWAGPTPALDRNVDSPPAEAPAPFRVTTPGNLERLKNQILRSRLNDAPSAEWTVLLRRAANEAASLAWLSAYPLLVFPELFSEKLRETLEINRRQKRIRTRSAELMAEFV